jgi:hypothetical protein
MMDEPDRLEDAKRRLAEMQARIAVYMPSPKTENGIRRGEKHSGRTLPIPEPVRPRPKRAKV